MDGAVEKSAMRKIYMRLLPFAILSYFLAYIDRINVSFAGLTMRGDLDMSAAAFGFAAGTFYWGYFIFEVPSNVILEKVGARLWIARIMITWGIFAGLTALVTGTMSFTVVRFLLGAAEAGFFPGILLYFTYWFPSNHHARIVSGFLIGLPIAVAAGAPISTALLGLDGMFGLQGLADHVHRRGDPDRIDRHRDVVPADRSAGAGEIPDGGGTELACREAGGRAQGQGGRADLQRCGRGCSIRRCCCCRLNYLGIVTASLGMLIFIPQIIKSLGNSSNMTVGWLTMIPYICGGIAHGDLGPHFRPHERAAMESARGLHGLRGGLVLAGMTMGTWWALVGMSIAAIGFYGSKGPFFAMPPMFLTGRRLAAGIAWINSIGNLGGFFGPWYVGLDEGLDGQLRGRVVWAGLVWSDLRLRLRVLPAYPEPCRAVSALGALEAAE